MIGYLGLRLADQSNFSWLVFTLFATLFKLARMTLIGLRASNCLQSMSYFGDQLLELLSAIDFHVSSFYWLWENPINISSELEIITGIASYFLGDKMSKSFVYTYLREHVIYFHIVCHKHVLT